MKSAKIRQAFCHGLWSPTKSDFLFSLNCLSPSEQQVALRFAYQRDVLSSIVGKLLIRGVVVRYLGLSPHDVKLERSPEGRPYLLDHSDLLDFNISHGGDFTIIAATSGGHCGADVMRVELPPFQRSVSDFVLKMKNTFSSAEVSRILSPGSEAERMRRFYEHWCSKEAYVKALGCGLRIPLKKIECDFADDGKLSITNELINQPGKNWAFEKYNLPEDHLAVVAWYENSDTGIRTDSLFPQLTFEQLVDKLTVLSPVNNAAWDQFLKKPHSPPSSRQRIQDN
ncbi:L-aminoadipate-semialdehyde dehydrogenase-phosphopantetheinyl transferase [Schistosoma japonicum]|uniref:L-aminoadipate-semialdehyde dehydrogenase-phosphopantetheinyl transferase n=1 Tax=Schistosoma japonicum TaxID=6182 RepID=A0A4Z2DSE8_SCHJA|nr:L-aminoadipate-semialdehyde dehydrogenase-phosphopantetheinyl transferase [Schistosoma japonicum]TNN19415.1 L-aminoadipate-semialdehyde dehydrogenase-phosphopantetheinyl transferase [Schistosoma japonicum]